MAGAALLLPRTVGDTVIAHGHIAATQADVILRELSEARDDHQLRALVLRACAALYEASAGASRASESAEYTEATLHGNWVAAERRTDALQAIIDGRTMPQSDAEELPDAEAGRSVAQGGDGAP